MKRFSGLLLLMGSVIPTMADKQVDWDQISNTPEEKAWYRNAQMPDRPGASCCGEADAYWADSWELGGTNKDQYVAIITDTRDDVQFSRRHVAPGTKILVPNHKIATTQGNPTGHGIIFIRWDDESNDYGVLCYFAPGGG